MKTHANLPMSRVYFGTTSVSPAVPVVQIILSANSGIFTRGFASSMSGNLPVLYMRVTGGVPEGQIVLPAKSM